MKPCDTLSLQSSWHASSRATHLHYDYNKFELPKQQWYVKSLALKVVITKRWNHLYTIIYYVYIYIFGSLWLFLSIFLSISISVFGSRRMPLRSLCLRPWWRRRFASCSFSRMLRRHWSSGLSKQPIGFTGWTLGPWWSLSINIFCTGILMLQTTHTSHSACFANR